MTHDTSPWAAEHLALRWRWCMSKATQNVLRTNEGHDIETPPCYLLLEDHASAWLATEVLFRHAAVVSSVMLRFAARLKSELANYLAGSIECHTTMIACSLQCKR